jgi:hypothetical protein
LPNNRGRTLAERLAADKIMVSGYHFPWRG